MKKAAQTEGKADSLWQKTKYANLVRNASSGTYFARFRHNGKLIWRGLETDHGWLMSFPRRRTSWS
jgi:hypothetical protein